MANPQLISYIKENRDKFPKGDVVKTLAAAGWQAFDISEAFLEVENPTQVVPPQKPALREPAPPQNIPAEKSSDLLPPAGQTFPRNNSAAASPDFLAEMEKHRQAAQRAGLAPIVEGNTEIRPSTMSYNAQTTSGTAEQKGIIGLLIKTGLVKTEAQANAAMIAFVVAMFAIIIWLVFF